VTFSRYNKKRFALKTNTLKYFICSGLLVFLIACSTKKNTFLSRNSHALSTKYNILYNGGIALDKGIQDVVLQNKDNFWERLPVERMQIADEQMMPGETKNANFERAETKATKAIQKHSMYIQGSEKNPQMDEAHLMLGKARYYDQRFVPALEAFNYVLYKYPNSDKIYEVKIWREKTNMRLENDALAVNNLRKLLKEIDFKDQIFADANATLAQAFLNLEEKDSAVAKIKIATEFTKSNEEKARYRFILAQLYEELGYKDSAYATYQSVIDMHRKAAKQYVIHAHVRQSSQFDFEKGDTIAFLKKYNDLLEDRENRPYLDVLNHQMGLFYDKNKNYTQAKKYYNVSLKKKSQDTYLIASNYRNLADIYFNSAKYVTAGKYYDSTLVQLKPRTREFNLIKKKRENLEDVIKYEGIAERNDSIISLYNMSNDDKKAYFEKYIEKLKEEEKTAQKLAEKAAIRKENQERDGGATGIDSKSDEGKKPEVTPSKGTDLASGGSNFYFYNPTTVAYGKKEFTRIWGKRTLKDNWRVSATADKDNDKEKEAEADKESQDKDGEKKEDVAAVDDKFTPDFYIKQLPTSATVIDSLAKERNFAYYQLGVIYKEKFKENQLAVNKFEQLLKNKPEERLVLPSMYNLYKLYQILDKTKAEAMKAQIIAQYPNSRYAQILNNPSSEIEEASDSPNVVYENIYKQYQNGEYKTVLVATENAIDRFTGEEIIPKFELLKAQITGKLSGLLEYSKALNFVALNYPNSEEGKRAEKLLSVDLPKLEALQLSNSDSKNWKILYATKDFEDKNTKTLLEKINKFIKDRDLKKLSISKDIYTMTDNFVVIHGVTSKDLATGITSILKEFKEYKVPDTPIIISTENYTIVQIKKNLDDFLAGKLEDNPAQPNWDGTLEKAPEPKQPKPQPKQEVINEQPDGADRIEDPKNGKAPQSLENREPTKAQQKGMGLPPAPQMEPNRKG
jgi:tetratricopeptide (TPR) repeat protein